MRAGRDGRSEMAAWRNARRDQMLELYARIGRALYALRVLFLIGIGAGAGLFVTAILDRGTGAQEIRLLLPLLVCLWSLFMAVLAYGFSGNIPVVDPSTGWRQRLVARMQRLLWHALALTVTGLGLATILFTVRAITTMRGAFESQ